MFFSTPIFTKPIRRPGATLTFAAALILSASLAPFAAAQSRAPTSIPAGQVAPDDSFSKLSPEQLDTLLGSIALYPDPLIAQILPAATYPIDIVRAARLVSSGATPDQLDQQTWDPSVKAISHYPTVLQLMDENIDWTQQLGQAFIAQPDDVMQAVQRLRLQAQTLGNLATTPQQEVLVEDDAVRILPANPDIIYVPTYDPAVIYYQQPVYAEPFLSFGLGFACGAWLDLDCDWHNHFFYRPGWTWNHWHDNFIIDRGHFIRPRTNFEPHRGERPPTIWHRDNARPLTLPGRRLTSPSRFDNFRGRDPTPNHRPTPAPVLRPDHMDRGRPAAAPTPHAPPPVTDHTQRDLQRGQNSRGIQPIHAPTPAPRPVAPPPAHVAPPPAHVAPPPAHVAPPAHVNPPPVHIAPPPPARPSPPAYVHPSPGNDGNKNHK